MQLPYTIVLVVAISNKPVKMPSSRGVAQPGSVLAWGASGRRFKSFRPDQENQYMISKFFRITIPTLWIPLIYGHTNAHVNK